MNRAVAACGVIVAITLGSASCSGVRGRAVDTADCQRARELLDTGGQVPDMVATPPWPRLSGMGRSAGQVIPPSGDGSEIPGSRSDLGMPDPEDETFVVVATVEDDNIEALRARLRGELLGEGWSPSDTGNATSGGALTSFSMRYERGDEGGSLSTVSCSDEPRTLLYLEQRQNPQR